MYKPSKFLVKPVNMGVVSSTNFNHKNVINDRHGRIIDGREETEMIYYLS